MKHSDYRKYYENYYDVKIPKGYEIHHIDLNHENNDINNLVSLPRKLHRKLHFYINAINERRTYRKNRFELDDLFRVGGNYDMDWNDITKYLKDYLAVAEEVQHYIVAHQIFRETGGNCNVSF